MWTEVWIAVWTMRLPTSPATGLCNLTAEVAGLRDHDGNAVALRLPPGSQDRDGGVLGQLAFARIVRGSPPHGRQHRAPSPPRPGLSAPPRHRTPGCAASRRTRKPPNPRCVPLATGARRLIGRAVLVVIRGGRTRQLLGLASVGPTVLAARIRHRSDVSAGRPSGGGFRATDR